MNSNISSPVLSFTVTRQCNLNCTYCYFPNKGNKSITKDIADSIIENYFKYFTNGIKKIRFLLSGGEPLLEKELVFHIMEKGQSLADHFGKSISFTLDTNGVLLSEQIVNKLQNYDVYVMSSIDGEAKIHDAQRPFLGSNAGSHELVAKNVGYALKTLGCNNVAVRFTLLPDGVHNLFKTFLYFYDFGFRIIDFAPNYETKWTLEEIQTYAAEMFKVTSFVIKNKVNNKLITNYIRWVLYDEENISAYGHPCGIIPTVDTNGDFYSCHRFIDNNDFYLGNYENIGQVITSIRSLSQQYVNYWEKYGAYAWGSCPANNVCHGCHPFQISTFFAQFINNTKEQVELALLEQGICLYIKRTMNYDINSGSNSNEYVLINRDNGEYLLLNKTGSIIASILSQEDALSFDELLKAFFHYVKDNSIDSERKKKDVLLFLKALQKEKIISLSL